jgi:hypothetical protein
MTQVLGNMQEDYRRLAHAFEKSIIPNYSSYDVDARYNAQKSSTDNGFSQPQPLYGMPMNSYTGQPQPPHQSRINSRACA